MDYFISQRDYDPEVCCLVKTVIFVVVAVFVLILPLGDPQLQCETKGSARKNVVFYYTCEAYVLAVKAANKVVETLKCVMCVLFEIFCETKVEETPSLKQSDHKKAVSDVPAKPKKDNFAMLKPKKDKKAGPSKSNSCPKCVEKGEVCPKTCSKSNIKKK